MQYVGRAFNSVSQTWSSINPATLSGAIDIIVVESDSGELSCSPFHVRFGKFQLLRPSQKKVNFIINGKLTNLPMKLGDGGEAFFVFEAANNVDVPSDMMTSPVLSATSSPSSSPPSSPKRASTNSSLQEPEFLDISQSMPDLTETSPIRILESNLQFSRSEQELGTSPKEAKLERIQKLSKKLTKINIPTKIDNNGDMFLDMNGYKSSEKNIHDSDDILKKLLHEEFGSDVDLSHIIQEDESGNIRIVSNDESLTSPSLKSAEDTPDSASQLSTEDEILTSTSSSSYVKTLRLTSDQLKYLDLKPGENDLCFSVDKGKALITSKLYLWKQDVPIVISDIDGTITKSDALGHVLTMLGRDWTHPGVAKLFQDIRLNGYNIMYLTARSVGQADSTRSYLRTVDQDGIKLPPGPVILSPDRTMAALKREVILKKPEVFKMACLNDLRNLYAGKEHPFYAGFGNRITDALSYRSVGIPSSRIFTINPDGEVHMELLELAGYRSSYVNINELVDHFFPAVSGTFGNDEGYTDLNYWREPLPELSDESDDENTTGVSQNSTFNSQRVGLDDLIKDYHSSEDEDYEDNGEADEDEEEDEDDDDEDDYEDDEYDEDEDDDFTTNSLDGSFEDDQDLDEELLNEIDTSSISTQAIKNNDRGFLPMRRKNSGISLNSTNIDGIRDGDTFVKASELMKELNLGEKKSSERTK